MMTEHLPTDMWTIVFPFLDVLTRYQTGRVCTAARALTKSREWEMAAMLEFLKVFGSPRALCGTTESPPFPLDNVQLLREKKQYMRERLISWHVMYARCARYLKDPVTYLPATSKPKPGSEYVSLYQLQLRGWIHISVFPEVFAQPREDVKISPSGFSLMGELTNMPAMQPREECWRLITDLFVKYFQDYECRNEDGLRVVKKLKADNNWAYNFLVRSHHEPSANEDMWAHPGGALSDTERTQYKTLDRDQIFSTNFVPIPHPATEEPDIKEAKPVVAQPLTEKQKEILQATRRKNVRAFIQGSENEDSLRRRVERMGFKDRDMIYMEVTCERESSMTPLISLRGDNHCDIRVELR
eukprot:Protomagalhaensia_wolfi_Nauph_80__2097@NODE_2343_length_1122_cov_9_825485_g1836_i0_p1_GENE_NODE_2343_length_1122_cov_9_825485_g1836_i0NODE_2343_length_1122_cov_9_825485_g1836_i0_p1_ORF_typecomplete_len356_score41_95_NODE_2343_length_1122_cov_9_825485_g1836_i0161083